ncbi:MAG TPA: hypothetical protein VEW68_03695 [Patescibacteria group bacterium]|nr:hypothetical protein [Patescibacteria group bacterium]
MSPPPGPEPDAPAESVRPARSWRAPAVIAASLIAIGATGVAYLHPTLGAAGQAAARSEASTLYQPVAIDLVSPSQGWVVALFDSGAYALLATSDGGVSWKKQLGGAAAGRTTYLRFFDSRNGVFALLGGGQFQLFRTADGGLTWTSPEPSRLPPNAMSVTFADPGHGWALLGADSLAGAAGSLLRTDDGGVSWTDLGSPKTGGDQAFRVQFANPQTGWLDSFNAGPYAYRSDDGGVSWAQVRLPAPLTGWPRTGRFFVAAHPTKGLGMVTTVINFQRTSGRSGIGGSVLDYPPLTVGTFDGGVPVRYIYATLIDSLAGGAAGQAAEWVDGASPVQAPGQVDLGSIDGGRTWSPVTIPGDLGAIGYADASDWWWIGAGETSTSSDGGGTWTPPKRVGLLEPLPATLEVLDARTAWFGAMAGTRPILATTVDGGYDWRMAPMPPITP